MGESTCKIFHTPIFPTPRSLFRCDTSSSTYKSYGKISQIYWYMQTASIEMFSAFSNGFADFEFQISALIKIAPLALIGPQFHMQSCILWINCVNIPN